MRGVCVLWLAAIFVSVQVAAQSVPSGSLEPVRVQLKWSHQFQFAGYYAALAQGYYAEAGFEVTLLEGRTNRSPRDVVLSGEAEFGVAGSELALGYLEGEPLVVLAAIFQHSPYALLTLATSGIREPVDLAGKRVMLRGGVPSTEIYAMLQQAGVTRERFEEIPMTFRHEDLLEGRADAMSVYSTDQPFFPDRPDAETVLLRPISYGVDFYGDCLFTTRSRVESQRERVEAFRAATLRGWLYAMDHPAEMVAHIQREYPGRRTDAQLEREAAEMESLILHELVPLGQMNEERWHRIVATYRATGLLEANGDLEPFIYRELSEVNGVALTRVLAVAGALALIVLGAGGLLIHFNRRLARAVASRTEELERLNRDLAQEVARRGEAEAAFREGEHYYRTLLERLPVGLALSTMNGELVFVNDAYAAMIGRTVDEVLRLTYWELTPEDYHAHEADVVESLKATGTFRPFEKEYFHALGHRVPVRGSGILLERGEEHFIWACVEDITDIRAAREALRHREEQYRVIFESIPLGLVVTNADGTIADANPAAPAMHGYDRATFLNLRPEDYIHPADLRLFDRYVGTVMAGREFVTRARNRTRDGRIIEVEVVGVPFEQDGARRVLGILQDVTARVRAEEALHLSEEKFRTIVETTKEWIWEIDLQGRHTYTNPAIESILGYDVDEFLALDLMQMIHPEDQRLVAEALPSYIERRQGWENWVLRWRHRDGTWRYLESNSAPILDVSGALVGYRGVDRDITDRIEAERLLRESMDALARHQEQLEELVRERTAALEQAQADLVRKERLAALGQLIGTVSHEIRNPLGTIRGSVFSVGQLVKKGDYSRLEPILARAERNIKRCDRIIEELLDFTRPRKLERQATALDSWLAEVLEEIPLEGTVRIAPALESGAVIGVDREQLRRAVVNLVNNAAQAMEGAQGVGDTIYVTTRADGSGVEIVITDEGPGIAPELMEKIFEPLFSTKGFGVGLGIPIIKDIVETHGGRLRYESTVGRGTAAHLWLPVEGE